MSASKSMVEQIKATPRFQRGEIDMLTLRGGALMTTHGPAVCAGPHCVVHNPSDHGMQDWDLDWRQDRGIFERICPHGVGHPDPDSVEYRVVHFQESSAGVHGCDGCCK